MVVIDPFLIRSRKRKDNVGYDVHFGFYSNEDKGLDSLRVMMATRLLEENEVKLVPYAFEKWEPEHRELTTFKSEFRNWGMMLEFADSLGSATSSIKRALQKVDMDEFLVKDYEFIYEFDVDI